MFEQNILNGLTFFLFCLMQPQIVNALGGPSNVSSPVAANAERSERILPSVSMSNLVSRLVTLVKNPYSFLCSDSKL
jgi:hypothetical protein